MSWGDALGGAAGIFGASQQDRAADNEAQAAQDAIAEQRRQFDQLQQNQQPYMGYGSGAGGLGGLAKLDSGDYSALFNSPEFKARTMFANQQFNDGAAAKYRLFSGGAQNDRDELNQNLAATGLGQLTSRLQWGANLGQNAAAGVGQAGMQSANNIGGLMQDRAGAQSSGYGGWAGAATGLAGIAAGTGWGGSSVFGRNSAPTNSSYGTNLGTTASTPWQNFGGPYG